MINLRRIPGVLYRNKTELGVLLLVALCVLYLMHEWGLVCTNYEIKREIDRLCKLYKAGVAVGNICIPLCETHKIHSVSCISQLSKKQFVFTAQWNKRLIVIKSARRLKTTSDRTKYNRKLLKIFTKESIIYLNNKLPTNERNITEKEFERKIRKIAKEKLNVTLTLEQLEEVQHLEIKDKESELEKRQIEWENVLMLLQSQEYLLLRLYSDKDVFPRIVGTCGHFYGVEYLERPKYDSLFMLDDKREWSERMRLAVSIMDFVEELETSFPDALHLCDVQMNHLGVTSSGRVKFLDLDLAYMKNVIDRILRSGRECRQHKDCDFFDCKSTCNLEKNICDSGIANDNLQTICEKIFIGWTMSGKMIIPGLLMSEYTPASLSALLRLCAENNRQPVNEDLRQRLYTTLTEMHQILLQKLSPN